MSDGLVFALVFGGFLFVALIGVIATAPAPLKDTLDGYEYRWPWWKPKRRKGCGHE